MLTLFLISISLGIFGAVWGEILTAQGFILDSYIKLLERIPDWLKKPLGYCSYCLVGQLALIGGFFMPEYSIILHVFLIVYSIFFTDIFTKILRI
jgi:hypothetical protein